MKSRHENNLKNIFKDFKATVKLENKEMTVIEWKNKNGDTNHKMIFSILGSTLVVTGDLGSNIFDWGERGEKKLSVEFLSELNRDYFFSKRQAKDIYEILWDGDICRKEAINYIEEQIEDGQEPASLKDTFLEEIEYSDIFEKEFSWVEWLNRGNNGERFFGQDFWEFAYSFGVDPDQYRHEAIFQALKGISKQVSQRKRLPEVVRAGLKYGLLSHGASEIETDKIIQWVEEIESENKNNVVKSLTGALVEVCGDRNDIKESITNYLVNSTIDRIFQALKEKEDIYIEFDELIDNMFEYRKIDPSEFITLPEDKNAIDLPQIKDIVNTRFFEQAIYEIKKYQEIEEDEPSELLNSKEVLKGYVAKEKNWSVPAIQSVLDSNPDAVIENSNKIGDM